MKINGKFKKTLLEWNSLKEAFENDNAIVDELKMFIENDGELYDRYVKPIMKNLARKMTKGSYEPSLAIKLWMYLVNDGAKKYIKEFGSPGDSWHEMYPKSIRLEVARKFAEKFEDDIQNNDYDIEELANYKPRRHVEEGAIESGDINLDRIQDMEEIMSQVGLSYRELLEDVLDVMDNDLYNDIINSLRKKYGYRY